RGVRLPDGKEVTFAELFTHLPSEPYVAMGTRGLDKSGFKMPPGPLDRVVKMPMVLEKDIASSVQIHEVEVDRLLGRVRVLRAQLFIDAGTIMSPRTAHS